MPGKRLNCLMGAILTISLALTAMPGLGQSADSPPLRVALAGLNHDHAAFFFGRKDKKNIVLVGIYEKNRVLIDRYVQRYHLDTALFYDNISRMLRMVKPEVVVAFCSTKAHLGVVEACAPMGIPVMVEKPLATTVSDALRMEQLAQKYHIRVLTDYETAWYPSTAKAYQLVDSLGYVGPIRQVIVHDGHQGPIEIGVSKEFMAWLGDPVENGGGALMDFGCYGANLMTYLMKGQMPLSVTAVTQHFQPKLYPKVEDEATIVLTYPQAQCIIEASWNWPFGRKDMEIYGEKGYVKTIDNKTIRIKNKDSEPEQTMEVNPDEVNVHTDPFSYLYDVIRGKIQVPQYSQYALDNNIIVVRILQAARQSAATGRTQFFTQQGKLPVHNP